MFPKLEKLKYPVILEWTMAFDEKDIKVMDFTYYPDVLTIPL